MLRLGLVLVLAVCLCVCVEGCREFTGGVCVLLRLGEVLSDDLLRLRGDPVGEAHGELHDEVAALRRVLGEGQALPSEPLGRPRLDDVVAGQRDDAVLQRGNADGAATQRLRGREEQRKG